MRRKYQKIQEWNAFSNLLYEILVNAGPDMRNHDALSLFSFLVSTQHKSNHVSFQIPLNCDICRQKVVT